jgi:hypothetical protein
MAENGFVWPMMPPGYHHTCEKCGFQAVLSGKRFPRTTHVPVDL